MKALIAPVDTAEDGFTLVEMMITLVISGIIIAAIYAVYTVQQRTYTAQDAVAEMQQNIRAALMLMSRDIRMAGLDERLAGAEIVEATQGRFGFTLDRDGDGSLDGPDEDITFGFSTDDDSNGDGIVDDLNGDGTVNDTASLGKDNGGGFHDIADNIQAIEFHYILDNGTSTTSPGTAQFNQIRSVQVSILARADRISKKFKDSKSYTTASGATWGPYDDEYRRRLLVTTVQCRNMGL